MKKMMLMLVMVLGLAATAQAATLTVDGKGDAGAYAKVSAAINAATDGDTISITTDTMILDIVRINKRLNFTAPAGLNPVIQHDGTTVSSVVTFLPGSEGAQFGSIAGGRITVQYNKGMSAIPVVSYSGVTNNTFPSAIVKFEQTTGTAVTMENVFMTEVGPTTIAAIHGIQHDSMLANTVNLRYVDIDLARPGSITSASYGIVIGTTGQTLDVYGRRIPGLMYTSQGGPTYNLDHVRVKNYTRTGLWNNYIQGHANLNYFENGPLGDRVGTATKPWGGIVNNQAAATFYCNARNSILRSSAGDSTTGGFAAQFGGNDSSITLSRCVLINKITLNTTSNWGALTLGMPTSAVDARLRLEADHCDIVDLSNSGANFAAINAGMDKTTSLTLVLTNNNIYSLNNKAIKIGTTGLGTEDSMVSSHNNVYGPGTSIGYTAGTGDVSFDPIYSNADASDMRYSNNTLKTADSNGGPVGTNGNYADLFGSGIVAGEAGVVNRAHGWTTLK